MQHRNTPHGKTQIEEGKLVKIQNKMAESLTPYGVLHQIFVCEQNLHQIYSCEQNLHQNNVCEQKIGKL